MNIPRLLLIAGLLGGAATAAAGLIGADHQGLPDETVASVNQHPISRDAWLRAVAAVASEQTRELTAEDQRHILDRLIDEELLVQHGIALGLAEQDGRIRSELVQQVMRSASATSSATSIRSAAGASAEPDDAALHAFYDANRDFFAVPARLRVAAWRTAADGSRCAFVPAVPDALLPPSTLRNYLGPTLTAKALTLRAGERSAPIVVRPGDRDETVMLELREVEPGATPPFEQVRDQVGAELKRRADEAAVRDLLAQLRKSGRVLIADGPSPISDASAR